MLDNLRVMISEESFRRYELSTICRHELEDRTTHAVYLSPAGTEVQVPIVDLHDCRWNVGDGLPDRAVMLPTKVEGPLAASGQPNSLSQQR